MPYVDEDAAELLLRRKVMLPLQEEGLLSEERSKLLLSWRHTGFSVHNSVRVEPADGAAVERLARYIMRSPISLERLEWDGAGEVRYLPKARRDSATQHRGDPAETIDAAELLARYARGDSPPPAGGRRPPCPLSGSAAAEPAIPSATATLRCRG